MSRKNASRVVLGFCGLAALLALGACTQGGNLLARDALIRNNPTPELETLDMRGVDRDNRRAITFNEDFRMLAEDWDRFWYVDRPSRLTVYPTR